MSLSNPSLTNPAQHFFEWKGGDGKLQFYDKEKQQSINVPLPFTFIVLDQLHTITGYSDLDQSRFWSNETRTTHEDFTVKTKRGVKYVGPYKNGQGIVQIPQGARYTKSIYIAHPTRTGEWIMGHIKLTGAALTAWIEFSKQHSITSGKISITDSSEATKGATKFHIPTLEWKQWEAAEYSAAVELDKQLQQYLSQYLTAAKYTDNAEPVAEDSLEDLGKATPEQQADFEERKKQRRSAQEPEPVVTEPDVVIDDFGDEPINLDDIPF